MLFRAKMTWFQPRFTGLLMKVRVLSSFSFSQCKLLRRYFRGNLSVDRSRVITYESTCTFIVLFFSRYNFRTPL